MQRMAGWAVLLLLSWAAGAQAQQSMGTFISGVNSRNLTFRPIDTSRALRTQASASRAFHSTAAPRTFSLGNFFPRLQFPLSWPPAIGTSAFPTTKAQTSTSGG